MNSHPAEKRSSDSRAQPEEIHARVWRLHSSAHAQKESESPCNGGLGNQIARTKHPPLSITLALTSLGHHREGERECKGDRMRERVRERM